MKKDNQPILIIDSGLGGINISNQLHCLLPQETIINLADTKHVPYSNKQPRDILNYVNHFIKAIKHYQPKLIVLACNTIDALAGDKIASTFPNIPVMRIIDITSKKVASRSVNKTIGVFATPHTIDSQSYALSVGLYLDNSTIYGISCDELAGLIEQQDFKNPELKAEIAAASELSCDTIVLGCTHFTLVDHMFKKQYPQAIVVDSSKCLIDACINKVKLLNLDYNLEEKGSFKVIVNDIDSDKMAIIKKITNEDNLDVVLGNEDFISE